MTALRVASAAILALLVVVQVAFAVLLLAGAVHVWLGTLAIAAGDYTAGAAAYGRANRFVPYRGDWQYAQAGAVRHVSGHEAAIPLYESSLRYAPHAEQTMVGAAESLVATGSVPGSRAMIARAASITPNDWRLYQLAGQIALRERRPDDAVAEFRRAARLAPGVEAAVQNPLANALYMTGQYAEAEHEASIAIAVQPSAPEHRLIRGKAKLELGNAMEARQDLALCVRAYRDLLERGKDVSGPLAEAENRLALAFIGEGRPLLALAALERLYADSPENAEAAVSAIEEWLLEEPGRAPAELWAFALDVMLDVGLADAVITFCDALPLAYREEVDRVFAPIRARALVLKGRSEEALELLSGMPEAAKSTPKYDLAVARTRAALGHTATARFEFRAVLENPDASPKDRRQAEDGLAALAR